MDSFTIYGLRDPRDGRIRYVGITTKEVGERLHRHILETKRGGQSYKCRWIRQVIESDNTIEIVVLETTTDSMRECYWYDKLKNEGCDLTNIAPGGNASFMKTHDANWNKKVGDANRGRKHKPEFGQSISERLKGRPLPESTRSKQSKSLKGKPWSESRRKAHKPKPPKERVYVRSEEWRRKISESVRAAKQKPKEDTWTPSPGENK